MAEGADENFYGHRRLCAVPAGSPGTSSNDGFRRGGCAGTGGGVAAPACRSFRRELQVGARSLVGLRPQISRSRPPASAGPRHDAAFPHRRLEYWPILDPTGPMAKPARPSSTPTGAPRPDRQPHDPPASARPPTRLPATLGKRASRATSAGNEHREPGEIPGLALPAADPPDKPDTDQTWNTGAAAHREPGQGTFFAFDLHTMALPSAMDGQHPAATFLSGLVVALCPDTRGHRPFSHHRGRPPKVRPFTPAFSIAVIHQPTHRAAGPA